MIVINEINSIIDVIASSCLQLYNQKTAMEQDDIQEVINAFKENTNPEDRYRSFDYCYNYFSDSKKRNEDVERGCLTLGFYLASWGMFRGSSFILSKSIKHFQPFVEYVAKLDKSVWKIDVDNYTDENIEFIMEIYKKTEEQLIGGNHRDLTLITKTLLGVFGFVPAYDSYFCATFRKLYSNHECGFRVVNKKSLLCIKDFYDKNSKVIDKLHEDTLTINFVTGKKTEIHYTKAKIIDMYGFQKGQQT